MCGCARIYTVEVREQLTGCVTSLPASPLILPSKAAAPKPAQSAPSTRWDQVFKCLSLRGKTVTQTTTEYLGRSEDNSEESTLFYLYVGPRD